MEATSKTPQKDKNVEPQLTRASQLMSRNIPEIKHRSTSPPTLIVSDGEVDESEDDLSLESPPSFLIGTSAERSKLFQEIERQVSESEAIDKRKERDRQEEQREAAIAENTAREIKERSERTRERREFRVPPEPKEGEPYKLVSVRHLNFGKIKRKFLPGATMLAVYDWVGSLCSNPEHFSLRLSPSEIVYPDENVSCITRLLFMKEEDAEVPLSDEDSHVFVGTGNSNESSSGEDTEPFLPHLTSTPVDQNQPPNVLTEWDGDLIKPDLLELRTKRRMYLDMMKSEKEVVLDRFNVMKQLLELYQNDETGNCKLVVRFKDEEAVGDGVVREMYSLFWEKFLALTFHGYTECALLMLPHLNPSSYVAVGRLISHQYLQCGTFPVRIAQASIQNALFGTVSERCLIRSFLLFLPPHQRQLLTDALAGKLPLKQEELIELFLDFRVSQLPSVSNVRKLVLEVANSEFVTKPFLAMMKIKEGMGTFWNSVSSADIEGIYQLSKPTAESVNATLRFQPSDVKEETVGRWLKRYLCESGDMVAALFLRYVTASDVLLPDQIISVRFEVMHELSLRPKSRTCFGVLTLAKNYLSYSHLQDNLDFYLRNPHMWDLDD